MANLVSLDGTDQYVNLDMIESIHREPDASRRNLPPDRDLTVPREPPMVTILTMQSGRELRTDLLPADVVKLGG